jgi:DNA (cytosine-5)-methyltransferase 1
VVVFGGGVKLLDLFCGAGGAAMGYYRAGFTEIIGIDIKRQPRYPFTFIQADALRPPVDLMEFNVIHASPPCQRYTLSQNASKNSNAHPDLIPAVRAMLLKTALPYVIENVPGSPLRSPIVLCGLAFDLKVKRHRLFESNVFLDVLKCPSHDQDYYLVHGREVRNRVRMGADPKGIRCGLRVSTDIGRQAMGIDWMNRTELSEAIPPAYTEFIGKQIIDRLKHDETCDLRHCPFCGTKLPGG